jgi:hypothetical protein
LIAARPTRRIRWPTWRSPPAAFLIANTNDFRNQLKKVSEDIETYYEVTYDPRIDKYDGAFHKIEVHPLRAGLRIQARSGYFALPPSSAKRGCDPGPL